MADEVSNDLLAPVVDHATKITQLEDRQKQHHQELKSAIADVRAGIDEAIASSAGGWQERITALEGKFDDLLNKATEAPAPAVEAAPAAQEAAPAAAAAAPEVAVETPEKVTRYVRRNGRRVKREV